MQTVKLERQPIAQKIEQSNEKFAYDKTVTLEPRKVQMVSDEAKVSPKLKHLGAVILFPAVGKGDTDATKETKRWISFDNMLQWAEETGAEGKKLLAGFMDFAKGEFIGATKLGISGGKVFLQAA